MRLRRRGLLAGLAGIALARPALARTYSDTVSSVGENLDTIRAKGRIRIAFYRDFAPFSAEGPQGWAGIDVDLAGLIAQELGVGLETVPFPAGENVDDDLRNMIWRGSVVDHSWANLMLHAPVSRELELRNELVVLFGPYCIERLAMALDPARFDGELTAAALVGHRIGVEVDTLGDFWLSMTQGGALRELTVHFREADQAIAALAQGEVAAVIAPLSQLEAGLGPERGRMEIVDNLFDGLAVTHWPIGCAVRENARDLGYAVGDIMAAAVRDGRIAAIFARHGVTWHSPAAAE